MLGDRAINVTLTQMFNQKLKQGWDQIRAADAMTDEMVRQNTQFLDSVGRQEVAMRSSGGSVDSFLRSDGSGGGGGGGRTPNDNMSDLIPNVHTLNHPISLVTKPVSNF